MHYANTYLEKPVVPDVKITGEGTTDVLKCMLNTGSDIYQGDCKKRGSTLKQEYKNASGTCYMDPRDMAKLGVNNWDTVLVKTDFGEVVVNCAVSRDAPHEGTVFICKGPWANTIVSHDTYCCSDPTYKMRFYYICIQNARNLISKQGHYDEFHKTYPSDYLGVSRQRTEFKNS